MNGRWNIRLRVLPEVAPVSWDEFKADWPPFSIALDGFVHGRPRFDKGGPRASYNHHEDVDRLATRSTCAQVHLAIRQGLFSWFFRDATGARAEVCVNDCDQDVCLSWYLIENHYRAEPTMNAALNRLVNVEDMLDATAGAYPYPADMLLLQEVAWVFDPYTRARASGALDGRDPATFRSIIEDVSCRIDRHLIGTGSSTPLDLRYERLDGNVGRNIDGVALVREVGRHARTALFGDGVRAFVAARQRGDGRWTYTLGRMSQYVPFDVVQAYEALNEAEGLTLAADRWGGGDTVGGSPRVAGSSLDPAALVDVLRTARAQDRP